MTENETETRHTVNESADKITLKWKCKRGNGTRDEDKFDVKVKGDDASEVADKLGEIIDKVEGVDDGRGLIDAARDIQPEDNDD